MDPMTIISLVNTGLVLVEKGIQIGHDVVPLIDNMKRVTDPVKPVTPADVEALEVTIRANSAVLQAEPPPEEE